MQDLHPYEVMLVLDPEADELRQEDVINRIRQIVEAAGGQLEAADALGRQRLAYEILQAHRGLPLGRDVHGAARGRGRGGSRAAHPRRRPAAHDRAPHRPLDTAPVEESVPGLVTERDFSVPAARGAR